MSRPIHDEARCLHCGAPLARVRGVWAHPWLYVGTCNDPTPDPDTIRLDVGK